MIEGNLVNLRAVEYADMDLICEWSMSDARRSFFMDRKGDVRQVTRDELAAMMSARRAQRAGYLPLAVERKDGTVIGCTALRGAGWETHAAEMQVAMFDDTTFTEPAGEEAVALYVDYLIVDKNIEKVFVRALTSETAYVECLKRLGFVEEGVVREFTYAGGEYLSVAALSVLRDEWMAITPVQRTRGVSGTGISS